MEYQLNRKNVKVIEARSNITKCIEQAKQEPLILMWRPFDGIALKCGLSPDQALMYVREGFLARRV